MGKEYPDDWGDEPNDADGRETDPGETDDNEVVAPGMSSGVLPDPSDDPDGGACTDSFLAPLSPEKGAIVASVNDVFLKWRKRNLSASYRQRLGYTHLVSHPGGRRKFMDRCRTGCDGGDDDHGYYGRSPFPSPHYFERKIVPIVSLMAKTPEEFGVISEDALECLKRLMVLSGRCTVFGNLLRGFFESYDGEYHGHRSVHGQFEYFYSKYGRFAALSVATLQGYQVDRHYDGGDYSRSTYEIERMFTSVLEKLPPEYWNDAFEVFYLYGGANESEVFWNKFLPEVADNILKTGKPHLFGYFFKLMKACPEISEHYANTGYSRNNGAAMLRELEALDAMPSLKEESLGLACAATRRSGERGHYNRRNIGVTFLDGSEEMNDLFYHSSINVPETIKSLREAGHNDDEIKDIFGLIDKLPGDCGSLVVPHYVRLETVFPGGVEGLLKYLGNFSKAPVAAYGMVSLFAQDFYGEAVKSLAGNTDKYLSTGARLAKKFGDSIVSYFNSSEVALLFAKVLKEDPNEFDEKIRQVEMFIEKFVKGSHHAEDVFRQCLAFCSHCGKESLGKFLSGFGMVLSDGKAFLDKRLETHREPWSGDSDSGEEAMIKLYKDSCYRFLLNEKVDGRPPVFPADFNFDDHAKIAVALGVNSCVSRGEKPGSRYFELLDAGLDYRLAAAVCDKIDGLSLLPDVTREEMDRVAGIVSGVHDVVSEVCNTDGCPSISSSFDKGGDGECRDLRGTGQITIDYLARQERVLDELAADPRFSKLVDFKKLRSSVGQAKSLLFFKEAVSCGIVSGKGDFSKDPFLSRAGDSTKAAIAGMSLMIATGAVHIPELDGKIKTLPVSLNPAKLITGGADPSIVSDVFEKYEGLLAENVGTALDFVRNAVLRARDATPGLMFVGGKIHTVKAMDQNVLKLLQKLFGFGNTPFHLIHAGESLVLPPMPTALEFKFLVSMMEKFGVIDSVNPDFQNAMGGRWSPETSAIVGASILLSTTRRVPYAPGAFSTTHDSQTGKRIMAYDAGVKVNGLPFDLPNAEGRTDILGRHDLTDADRFQLLGCLATHRDYNGRFEGLFEDYSRGFVKTLGRNGLLEHLRESAWIFDHAKDGDTPEDHEKMVKRFTDVWDSASRQVGFGVIGDVNRLLMDTLGAVQGQRERIIIENPDDYGRLMQY